MESFFQQYGGSKELTAMQSHVFRVSIADKGQESASAFSVAWYPVYIPLSFDLLEFTAEAIKWFAYDLKVEARYLSNGDFHTLRYKGEKNLLYIFGSVKTFDFQYRLDAGVLKIRIQEAIVETLSDMALEDGKKTGRNFQAESSQKEVFLFVRLFALFKTLSFLDVPRTPFTPIHKTSFIEPLGCYCETMDLQTKLFVYNHLENLDAVLAFLEISELKDWPHEAEIPKNIDWYFLFTIEKTILLGFNALGKAVYTENLLGCPMKVIKEIGRDTVHSGGFVWLTTRQNDSDFLELQTVVGLSPNSKVRAVARKNWKLRNKNKHYEPYAYRLLQKLHISNKKPVDELKIRLLQEYRKQGSMLIGEENRQVFGQILHEILKNMDKSGDFLKDFVTEWQIPYDVSLAFLEIMLKLPLKQSEYQNFLAWHEEIREQFLKAEKDKDKRIEFDLRYSSHLLNAGHKYEATRILEKILSELPDETLFDLLPSKKTNLTEKEGGQLVRIFILEAIAESKGTSGALDLWAARELARLQPLVSQRLKDLKVVAQGELAVRVSEALNILSSGGLVAKQRQSGKIFKQAKSSKPLPESSLSNLIQHPASRKGGIMDSLQKWLAEIKVPEQSVLKNYAERLSSKNYPEHLDAVSDIMFALGMKSAEFYVGRGDKARGFKSFEDVPPFFLVGYDHFDPNSELYMNLEEFKFAVGVEAAHLHFKHSRITSNDVWRGARGKSLFVLEGVLAMFPGWATLSSLMVSWPKLSKYAQSMQTVNKFNFITSNTKHLINAANKTADLLTASSGKKASKELQEEQLLATSRVMEFTADRAGLVFSGDLNAAIRGVFLSSDFYSGELYAANRYGLDKLLSIKNDAGEFIHQDLAVRIGALISFYLSEEYEDVVALVRNNDE